MLLISDSLPTRSDRRGSGVGKWPKVPVCLLSTQSVLYSTHCSAVSALKCFIHTAAVLSCGRFKLQWIYTAAGSAQHILHSFHLQCAAHTYFTAKNCLTGWLMIFPRHLLQKHNTFETPFCSKIILTLGWQCFWMKIRQLGKIRHEDGAALFQCRLSAWCMQFIQITTFVLLSLNLY